jgi:putative SOS response-associated peptidase YedK
MCDTVCSKPCNPNALVAPIRPKAIITMLHANDHERWLNGKFEDVLELQRPNTADFMTVCGPAFPARRIQKPISFQETTFVSF